MPTLGSVILAYETHGLAAEARGLAFEVVELAQTYAHSGVWTLAEAFFFSRTALEFESKLRGALEGAPKRWWTELAFACPIGTSSAPPSG